MSRSESGAGLQRLVADHRKLRRIASKAIAEGYGRTLALGHVKLNDPDCDDPCRFTLYNRGGRDLVTGARIRPLSVHGAGRCRKCDACKKQRSRMWTARAIDECNRWRTAFGTFTLSPENHLLLDNRARARLWPEKDFDRLRPDEQFSERAREFGAEVTNWLDRIRHGRDGHTPTKIRYLLVAEAHDSERTSDGMRGLPHFHMLLHEVVAGTAIKGSPPAAILDGAKTSCDVEAGEWERRNVPDGKGGWRPAVFVRDEAFIRKNWTLGFTKWQWAEDARAAYYVCKYVSKSMFNVRVRASKHYGRLGNSSAIDQQSMFPTRSQVATK